MSKILDNFFQTQTQTNAIIINMGILFHGITDIGKKRKTNQDAIYTSKELNLFVVADGMGGHRGGDIASSLAIKYAPDYLLSAKDLRKDPKVLSKAYQYANEKIYETSSKNPHLKGMGTTLVCLYFTGPNLYVANVGDSRAYLCSKGKIYQLTKDHSLVQEKLNLGLYNREQAKEDQMKNVLVRTIGFEPAVEVDVYNYRVHRGDILFVCSDGLHGKVSDRDLTFIINKNIPAPLDCTQEQVNKTVQDMVDLANKNGGQDNISAILAVAK